MECNIYYQIKKNNNLVSNKKIQSTVFKVLAECNKGEGQVSVHLVSTRKIKELNSTYRHVDKVTDVLSFRSLDGEKIIKTDDLGDIFISPAKIIEQAKEYKVSFKEEFIRMLVHGVLHLIGYDHEKLSDENKMFKIQDKLLNKINI